MAIPAHVVTYFVLVKSQRFAGLQVLFDVPAAANGQHDERQGRVRWGPDQIEGQLVRVVEAAAKNEPMATVGGDPIEDRQPGPIEEPRPFGALALAEAMPVLWVQCVSCDIADITEQASRWSLHTDHFDGGNSHRVGVALLLEKEPQVKTVAVHGIGDHPAERQARRLGALDHAFGQFRFGRKGDSLRNMHGVPARQISAPVCGQIQFAVDEGMAQFRDVGEEDADLTIFDASSAPAILGSDASRVAPAFGKANARQ